MENIKPMITVQATIKSTIENIWKLWTTPADIMQWNNPTDDWHTLSVEIDLKDEGRFLFRMETKDGSAGFDFGGKYDKVITNKLIEYTLDDGRKTINKFMPDNNDTILIEIFEPETETPLEIQREFCQSVVNNFKKYAENEKKIK